MSAPKRTRPGVEVLEAKQLLSALAPLHHPLHSASALHTHGNHASRRQNHTAGMPSGTLAGVAAVTGTTAGGVTTFVLHGDGQIRPIQAYAAQGTLQVPGPASGAPSTGALTLYGSTGAVTLKIQGPGSSGTGVLPSGTYQYVIVSGAGSYQGLTGQGTFNLSVGLTSTGPVKPGGPPVTISQITFALNR